MSLDWARSPGASHRALWTTVDQAISSLTNFLFSIVALKYLTLSEFGAFTVAYVTFAMSLDVQRALVGQPLTVTLSGSPEQIRFRGGSGLGAAFSVGLLCGLVVAVVGFALGGDVGTSLISLALVIPGLLVQDAWRHVFFASGLPKKALVNDSVWGGSALVAIAFLVATDNVGIPQLIFAWGVSGTLAGVAGWYQVQMTPRMTNPKHWFMSTRALGGRFLIEQLLGNGASQVVVFGIGLIAGLEALGSFNAARTVFGPVNILFLGLIAFAIPEGVRLSQTDVPRFRAFIYSIAAGLSLAVSLTGASLALLPTSWGVALLPQSWMEISPLFLPMAAVLIGESCRLAAFIGLRALAKPKHSLRAQTLSVPLWIAGGLIGAWSGGALGAVYGFAVANVSIAALWWVEYGSVLRSPNRNTK
ncbi:MAG: hypothetical protein OEM99_03380 [Gammaproteobacteria bacterium]|nr:hypothetical protein [Gammaproteobacteria bacterium]